MICNYCGCEESDIIAEYARFEKNNVLQCKNCGLVYLEIKKGKKEIESFYVSQYRKLATMPIWSPEEHFYHEITINDANNRIVFITNYMDITDKRILEVGSASGRLLHTLLEHGCKDTVGIELGEEVAKYAQEQGFKVFTRPIEELAFKEEFDAVVCFFTLEHVYDAMAVIRAVYTALKPGGYFLGEVPNQNDWRIQIFNDEIVKRFHFDPNHYYYYSPTTLRNYLDTCGFGNIKLETVERYNSLVQLRDILYRRSNTDYTVEETLKKYIFPKSEKDDVRLPHADDPVETKFNKIFGRWVNSELMGNVLRFVAVKN